MASYELEAIDVDDPDLAVVALTGELDLTNAGDLAAELDALVPRPRLVLDLNGVVFIDSAALHRLFQLARQREPDGLALVLDPGSPIAAAVEIVELDRVVPIASTLDAARQALA